MDKKTQRIQKACDQCYSRRVKCDGEEPCKRCAQKDEPCSYYRPQLKRGPKSGFKRKRESDTADTPTEITWENTSTTPSMPTPSLMGMNMKTMAASLLTPIVDPRNLLPARHVQETLVKLFFQHVKPTVPILHEPTFMRSLDTQPPIIILSLMGATLAEAMRDPTILTPDLVKIAESSVESVLQLMLPYIVSSQSIPLEVYVAALHLDAAAGNNQHSRLVDRWLGFSIAATKQHRLNFEVNAPPSFSHGHTAQPISWLEQEQRRRVLWRLYTYDRASALQCSRTVMLTDLDCRVCLPCPESVWEQQTLPELPCEDSEMLPPTMHGLFQVLPRLLPKSSPLQLNLVLASVLGHLSQSYYSGLLYPGSQDQQLFSEAMDLFWKHIPQGWKDVHTKMSNQQTDWWKDEVFDNYTGYGLFVCHGMEILIRSPWELPRMLKNAPWLSSSDFSLGVQHADMCSRLLKGILLKNPDLHQCPAYFGFFVVASASIILVQIKRSKSNKNDDVGIVGDIQVHISAMSALGKRWNVASRLSLLLKAALETDWIPSRGSFEQEAFITRQSGVGEALLVLADLASAHKAVSASLPPPIGSPWDGLSQDEEVPTDVFDLDRLLEGDGLETFLYSSGD